MTLVVNYRTSHRTEIGSANSAPRRIEVVEARLFRHVSEQPLHGNLPKTQIDLNSSTGEPACPHYVRRDVYYDF
jgi:hypothetical protein